MHTSTGSLAGMIIILSIYFVPAIVGYCRFKKARNKIAIVNVLFGWTLLGWVICFFWACMYDKQVYDVRIVK